MNTELQTKCVEFKKQLQVEKQLMGTFCELYVECEINSNDNEMCKRFDFAMKELERKEKEIDFLARCIARTVLSELNI